MYKVMVVALIAALAAAVAAGSSTGSTRSSAVFHSVVLATLSSTNEAPKGPAGASGSARVTLNLKTGVACWRLTVKGLPKNDKKLSAYVHKGKARKTGMAVIPLGSKFSAKGCVRGVPKKSLRAIGTTPAGFYVNVYTKRYQQGAVRGQLRAG